MARSKSAQCRQPSGWRSTETPVRAGQPSQFFLHASAVRNDRQESSQKTFPFDCGSVSQAGTTSSSGADEARDDDAEETAGTKEAGEVVEIEDVRPEVLEGVDRDDGVEEPGREGEGMRLGPHRADAVGDSCLDDPPPVVVRVHPEVDGLDVRAELPREEDRRHRLAAPEVEDAHPGRYREPLAEPLEKPEGVRPHLVSEHPVGVVAARSGKLGAGENGTSGRAWEILLQGRTPHSAAIGRRGKLPRTSRQEHAAGQSTQAQPGSLREAKDDNL